MRDVWILGALILIFGLLSSLQPVSANEAVNKCDILSCPIGFTCCDNECCPEGKFWDPANDPFRFLIIILCIIFPLFFICGFLWQFCLKCLELQHDIRTADHQTTPEPPSIAPLESMWVTSWDPPPPYNQVVPNPSPTEPPPPYSLRPEGPPGQMRGNSYATL